MSLLWADQAKIRRFISIIKRFSKLNCFPQACPSVPAILTQNELWTIAQAPLFLLLTQACTYIFFWTRMSRQSSFFHCGESPWFTTVLRNFVIFVH